MDASSFISGLVCFIIKRQKDIRSVSSRAIWPALMSAGLLFASILPGPSQEQPPMAQSHLFPIVEDGRFGFIDGSGKTVIACSYDWARPFSEGLAAVFTDGKWGYIDRTGEMAVEPQFEQALDFREGLAVVYIGNKARCINKAGEFAFEATFDSMSAFSEGLSCVSQDGKYGFIDHSGSPVIPPRFYFALPFCEGLAVANRMYIDKQGKPAISSEKYLFAYSFSEGLGRVEQKRGLFKGMKGNAATEILFIDREGKRIVTSEMQAAGPFNQGLAPVAHIGFVNTAVVKPKFVYIDTSGKIAFKMKFRTAGDFSEGLAAVAEDRLVGYIDREGRYGIVPQFDAGLPFRNGLALVEKAGRWGYIDAGGRWIWQEREGGQGAHDNFVSRRLEVRSSHGGPQSAWSKQAVLLVPHALQVNTLDGDLLLDSEINLLACPGLHKIGVRIQKKFFNQFGKDIITAWSDWNHILDWEARPNRTYILSYEELKSGGQKLIDGTTLTPVLWKIIDVTDKKATFEKIWAP